MRDTKTLAVESPVGSAHPVVRRSFTTPSQSLAGSLLLARLAIGSSVITLALLASLHLLSPEFGPSWRMVSEYALGRYGWVLSLMFVAWGASTWALTAAVRPHIQTRAGRIGLVFLMVAGLGEVLAAVFDINHDLGHGLAGVLGMGGLPIGALLVTFSLDRTGGWVTGRSLRHALACFTCLVPILLIASTVAMAAQFAQVNGGVLPDRAPSMLPAGVLGLDGWADRLLVLSFCIWQIVVGWQATRVGRRKRATPPKALIANLKGNQVMQRAGAWQDWVVSPPR